MVPSSLDSFAGSGTTAHAVLALEQRGRRQSEVHPWWNVKNMLTLLQAERVRRVINGVENAKDKTLRDGIGGSFAYCTLGEPTEIEGMLTGEALPSYSALAAHLLFTAVPVCRSVIQHWIQKTMMDFFIVMRKMIIT